MIRIDDERGDSARSSSILSFWKIQYCKEMHGGRRGPSVHLFSSESGPALIRADGTNRETDAGTLKKMFLHQLFSAAEQMKGPISGGNGRK